MKDDRTEEDPGGTDAHGGSEELRLEVDILGSEELASTTPSESETPRDAATVLLAEDDPDMRAYVRRCLALEDEVGALVERSNGAEALAYLRDGPVDLVVCDAVMPLVDGLELCRTIRSDPSLAHLPVLMVTGELTSSAARTRALEAGATELLIKPFNAQKLCACVLRLLRSRAPP